MQSFWRLLGYIRNYRLNVALNILCNILTAFFTVASLPLMIPFLRILFDQAQPPQQAVDFAWDAEILQQYLQYTFGVFIEEYGKETALVYVCSLILASFFFKNLFRYFSLFFMAPVRNGIIRDLRQQLFGKLLILPLSYFSDERKGDLISRITADVQEVEWSILNVLEAVFREPLVIAGSLGIMLLISPPLTLFVFILIIFTALVIGGIGKTLRKPSGVVQEKLGQIVSITEEALSGLRVIKGFNAQQYQHTKFGEVNNEYRRALTHLLWRKDLASPLSEFLGITVVAVLLWYGSRQVFSSEMDAATFLSFIMSFYYVIDPSKSLTRAIYNIQKGLAAMLRVERILDADHVIPEPREPMLLPGFTREIEYRNVGFRYTQGGAKILDGIHLKLNKGRALALVGASGAGKSTLADLLPRFYDVTEGGIFIDGINIRQYRLQELRSLIGIVTQEPILFNDTIYNNIVFGLDGISEREVTEAARIANAHDFILATDQGYQTVIGDRGSKLSGGQRQRLTIARAILKNPPILILDEATSSLDSESEKLVQQALVELMKNRTSVIIAHRLSTIQHADEIIVMERGRVVERGSHEALMALEGEYRKLVALQKV